jgi:hypothetical protein
MTFTENVNQTNSSVELCKAMMKMIDVDKHDQTQILNRNICTLLEECEQTFLNNQVNEAAFMLVDTSTVMIRIKSVY